MNLLKKPKDYKSFLDKVPIKMEPLVLCVLVEDAELYDYHIIHADRSIYGMMQNNEMSIKLRGSTYNEDAVINVFTNERLVNIGKILLIDSNMDKLDETEKIVTKRYSAKFYNHILTRYNRNRVINYILETDI